MEMQPEFFFGSWSIGTRQFAFDAPNAIVPSSTKALAFKTRQKINSVSLETVSAIREAWWDWDDPDSEERQYAWEFLCQDIVCALD